MQKLLSHVARGHTKMRFYFYPSRICPNCKREDVKITPTGIVEHGIPNGPLWVCYYCDPLGVKNEL